MLSLHRAGHIIRCSFSPAATNSEIDEAVKEKFGSIHYMAGWRLLSKRPRGRGTVPILIAHKTSNNVNINDIEWYARLRFLNF